MDVCGVPHDEQRPEDLAMRALLSGDAPWSAGRGEGGQHPKCLLFVYFWEMKGPRSATVPLRALGLVC